MQHVLLNGEYKLESSRWQVEEEPPQSQDFPWPEIIALSAHSVEHSLNPNPLDPRVYVSNNEAFIQAMTIFRRETDIYYGEVGLRRITNAQLKKLLGAKIQYDGQKQSTSGRFF
jgi:hypothetical protein